MILQQDGKLRRQRAQVEHFARKAEPVHVHHVGRQLRQQPREGARAGERRAGRRRRDEMKIDAAIDEDRLGRAGLHDADVRAARGRRDRDVAEPLPVAQDVALASGASRGRS